jgi:hypothetical protein
MWTISSCAGGCRAAGSLHLGHILTFLSQWRAIFDLYPSVIVYTIRPNISKSTVSLLNF